MAAKNPRPLSPLAPVAASTGGAVYLVTGGWPVTVLGCVLIIVLIVAIMWVVSDRDRTRRLASLIRAIRRSSSTRR